MTHATATGGCLCGGIRYRIAGTLDAAGYCHCTDCRRTTGSAFNVSVGVRTADFRLISGDPNGFSTIADSGATLTRHFCADCGSPIYTSSPNHPDTIYIKAGSLDDPAVVVPDRQSWTRSRVDWSIVPVTVRSSTEGNH